MATLFMAVGLELDGLNVLSMPFDDAICLLVPYNYFKNTPLVGVQKHSNLDSVNHRIMESNLDLNSKIMLLDIK